MPPVRMRLIDLYHRLPPRLQSWAASIYGYRLHRMRYGPDTDPMVEDALALERLPADHWRRRQAADSARMLRHAVEHVPYYRNLWVERRRQGFDPTVLADWPILEKDEIRKDPTAFLDDGARRSQLHPEHTSGTTSTPLHVWWSRRAVRRHFALFEARWRRWNGVTRHDRWALLGARFVVPISRRRPPYWVWNAGLNQLYLSSYHLSTATAPDYLEAMRRYGVRYIWGFPSSLHSLAVDFGPGGAQDLGLKVAISMSEYLSPVDRATISRAFGCPVRDTYGMAELVASGGECEAGAMHLWPESGVVEVVEGHTSVPPGTAGDLVCTGLLNDAMPLVRYRIGDRGALADDSLACSCGRTLPQLKSLEGRSEDVIFSVDGRRVARFDPIFKADLPVREAQIIQDRLDSVRIRIVPMPGYDDGIAATIERGVRERLGDVAVHFETVPAIERTERGKFRAVVCALPPEVRRRLAERQAVRSPAESAVDDGTSVT
jgi:phenylacetate-CoA ligase